MNDKEFKALLDRYCNGDLNDQEFVAFETAMLQDASKRAYYLRYMNLDAALKEGLVFEEEGKVAAVTSSLWLRAALFLFSLGSILALMLFMNHQSRRHNSLALQESDELSNDGVAIITKALGIEGLAQKINIGTTLKAGLLEIPKGMLQLELYSGVLMIVEGPAKLDLIDPMRVVCHYGQVRSRVPTQAIGFKISSADYDVIDLGTEFSLKINQVSGQADFAVHEGEIELHNKQNALLKSLKTGESTAYSRGTLIDSPLAFNTTSFEKLQLLYKHQDNQKLLQWHNYAETMKTKDEVVLFYDFEPENSWSRTLKNKSVQQAMMLNGAVVGCQWSTGRWEGKGALDYKSISDRVRLDLQGVYGSLSLSAWVKIDSFDRWLSSLFLTDSYDRNEIHWQLSDKGEIILGVNVPKVGNTFSAPVLTPEHLGKWCHIMTVIDQGHGEIRHYMNGEQVHLRKINVTFDITFGAVEIGNWNSTVGKDNIRSLNGRMDEFVLFNRALSREEVSDLYLQGKPD